MLIDTICSSPAVIGHTSENESIPVLFHEFNFILFNKHLFTYCFLRCVLFRLQPWLRVLSRSVTRIQVMLYKKSRLTCGKSKMHWNTVNC